MILLLGFKAYDDFDTEYLVTGDEALRIAQLLDHPLRTIQGVTINVTICTPGLDNGDLHARIDEHRADLRQRQLDLLTE